MSRIKSLKYLQPVVKQIFSHLAFHFHLQSLKSVKNMRRNPFHGEICNEQGDTASSEGNLETDSWDVTRNLRKSHTGTELVISLLLSNKTCSEKISICFTRQKQKSITTVTTNPKNNTTSKYCKFHERKHAKPLQLTQQNTRDIYCFLSLSFLGDIAGWKQLMKQKNDENQKNIKKTKGMK